MKDEMSKKNKSENSEETAQSIAQSSGLGYHAAIAMLQEPNVALGFHNLP